VPEYDSPQLLQSAVASFKEVRGRGVTVLLMLQCGFGGFGFGCWDFGFWFFAIFVLGSWFIRVYGSQVRGMIEECNAALARQPDLASVCVFAADLKAIRF